MEDYSYIGVGKISLRIRGAAAGLIPVGNCSALSFAVNEGVKELKDFTTAGGGTWNETRRIESVETSMTMHDLSPANLARALRGATNALASAVVSNEQLTVYAGAFLKTAKPIDLDATITVEAQGGLAAVAWTATTAKALGAYGKPTVANLYYYKVTTAGTTGAAQPTWPTTVGATVVDGTVTWTCMGLIVLTAAEYSATAGGIYLAAGAAVTNGEILEVDYTSSASNVIEALVNSGEEYELVFDGLNEARSGKAVIVEIYRQKFGAAQSLSLIGEDYAALELTGKQLKDLTKTGTGISQYFKATEVA